MCMLFGLHDVDKLVHYVYGPKRVGHCCLVLPGLFVVV